MVRGQDAVVAIVPRVWVSETGEGAIALSDSIAYFLVFVKCLLIFVATVFFISGLDDFFIDVFYIVRGLYRRLFVMPRYQPLTEEHLMLPREQAIAVVVPAWDESAIITKMLENSLHTFNYSRYHIFVGTYPNDPATSREVENVRELYDNVHCISCPHDGPTNKADCLNWIYQGIREYEKNNGEWFEILVLHDAEDVVHPLSLKLFNYLIPRKDMVQLPVFVLESKWHQFTAGHYIDEFAEYHLKDLLVRERLAGVVPGAGVGCAYSRRALDLVAEEHENQIFSTESLTEDYDLSFRLHKLKLKLIFVKKAIYRAVTRKSYWTGKPRVKEVKEYIATREYFPSTFMASVRQKSRWITGIAFQGWANIGWKGGWWTKYMLFRDRKVIVTNQVNALAYIVVITVLALWIADRYFADAYRYPPLVEAGTWLWYLILVDTFFLLWRLSQRVANVLRVYGWQHAALALPRVVWANSINFVAALRASYLFARYLVSGKLVWEKTKHSFPTEAELAAFHSKLGELLLARRHINVHQLDEALRRQQRDPRPLGAILVEMGVVGEDELIQALGVQLRLSTSEIDPYQTPLEVLEILPRSVAARYSVYPLDIKGDGTLVVAAHQVPTYEQLEAIRKEVGRKIELCLSARSDVAFAIRRGYERLEEDAIAQVMLGRVLLDHGLITPDQLEDALKVQRRAYRRLGDILIDGKMMAPEDLDAALDLYNSTGSGFLGEFLVQENYITLGELQKALQVQKSELPRLGEVLISQLHITQEVLEEVMRESQE
jgi:adsorption protein B